MLPFHNGLCISAAKALPQISIWRSASSPIAWEGWVFKGLLLNLNKSQCFLIFRVRIKAHLLFTPAMWGRAEHNTRLVYFLLLWPISICAFTFTQVSCEVGNYSTWDFEIHLVPYVPVCKGSTGSGYIEQMKQKENWDSCLMSVCTQLLILVQAKLIWGKH